jgi:D-glycero-alpha-D-manno-heptose-7-phosphate kinase
MVHARAWCRVDLAGGTLDIWPLGLLHDDARTVNVAVDLPADVRIESRRHGWRVDHEGRSTEVAERESLLAAPETALVGLVVNALDLPPSTISLSTASPRGAGLGGSSALACALVAAVARSKALPLPTATEIVALVRDLEARLMARPTGCQDQFAACLGGALEIRHRPGGEVVRRLIADLDALGRSLVVAYTGQSHVSAASNWQVVRRRLDGEPQSAELFAGIAAVSAQIGSALEAGDLPTVGRLMSGEWSYRRQLAAEISTPAIETLLTSALELGAWGGKACGAGGGGCVAVLAEPERVESIAVQWRSAGAQVLPVRPVADGLAASG